MSRPHISNDTLLKLITFVGAFSAVLAQANDLTDPRYWLAALAAGCGAVLALMRAPNTTPSNQQRPPIGGGRG